MLDVLDGLGGGVGFIEAVADREAAGIPGEIRPQDERPGDDYPDDAEPDQEPSHGPSLPPRSEPADEDRPILPVEIVAGLGGCSIQLLTPGSGLDVEAEGAVEPDRGPVRGPRDR